MSCGKTSSKPIELDVFLNNGRNYVQGSQIISKTAFDICRDGGRLIQASFNKITTSGICYQLLEAKSGVPSESIGTGIFENSSKKSVHVAWLPTTKRAPEAKLSPNCSLDLLADSVCPGVIDASYEVGNISSTSDYIDAIVQSIKKQHISLAGDVKDVWFTGLRRGNIQFPKLPVSKGVLSIKNLRLVSQGSNFQSMQQVTLHHKNDIFGEAVVSFSFKSKDFENVN